MIERRSSFETTAVLSNGTDLAGRNTGIAEISGKSGLIVCPERFLNLEVPAELLNTWITPVQHFFVRNHMPEPTQVDLGVWTLTVNGEVQQPLELRFTDLSRFPTASVVNTLECAGNGRAFFDPRTPGIQWQRGAIGTALFSGIKLKDVLSKVEIKSTGRHVMFKGADEPAGEIPPFVRSIPVEKALHPDTLIATHMNGRPLLNHHGFPARALVPGWIGAASVKWLNEIRVLDRPFEGYFMNPGYRMPIRHTEPAEAIKPEDTASITALTVKSIIAQPVDGTRWKRGPLIISGAAWAGEHRLEQVHVSTDGGSNWHEAQLESDAARYAWRLWSYVWHPKAAGEFLLMSRATDRAGNTQPPRAFWNPSGYMWNAIDQVTIHMEA